MNSKTVKNSVIAENEEVQHFVENCLKARGKWQVDETKVEVLISYKVLACKMNFSVLSLIVYELLGLGEETIINLWNCGTPLLDVHRTEDQTSRMQIDSVLGSPLLIGFHTLIERVSIECRKTKTKVITLANQKNGGNPVNQSKLEVITRSRHKARQNVHAWLKKWRENFEPITE